MNERQTSCDAMLLVQLLAPLGADPPGSRIAVARPIAQGLVEAGHAVVVGDEDQARAVLRRHQRPQERTAVLAEPDQPAPSQDSMAGPLRSPGRASP